MKRDRAYEIEFKLESIEGRKRMARRDIEDWELEADELLNEYHEVLDRIERLRDYKENMDELERELRQELHHYWEKEREHANREYFREVTPR